MSRAVKTMTDLGSFEESYKFNVHFRNKGKANIYLKFVEGKPQIINVTKAEDKLFISDILCLHRYE